MARTVKVLQFSTHDEECGIAKYQEQFIENIPSEDFETKMFRYSPNQTKNMTKQAFSVVLDELRKEMVNFDILHIQHELSFFKHTELQDITSLFTNTNKKVVITVHTAPHAQFVPAKMSGIGIRSVAYFLRTKVSNRRFIKRFISPLNSADIIIVHNQKTKQSLASFGVNTDLITKIKIPVPEIELKESSHEITNNLRTSKTDVIFCTVGFLSRMKGITHAIKALHYLPQNYKLAIIGGNHPDTLDGSFYDEICDLIQSLDLKERVYITGYVKEDLRLNALIDECNICVYPFDSKYYSYVSSASLNNAFANKKPVIAYPTEPFAEVNESDAHPINFCKSSNYYELAREIRHLDIDKAAAESKKYTEAYSYSNEAPLLLNIYRSTVSTARV